MKIAKVLPEISCYQKNIPEFSNFPSKFQMFLFLKIILDLLRTFKKKLAKSVQSFSSDAVVNEKRFIFLYLNIIYYHVGTFHYLKLLFNRCILYEYVLKSLLR